MAPRFQVVIRNHAGVAQALLVDWRHLQYTLRVNAPDTHVLSMDGNGAAAAILLPDAATDYQIEVYRSDLALTPPLAMYLDYEGFHRTPVDQVTERGTPIFTSYGRGYDDLLGARAILYPAGSAGSTKTGPGEHVIKAYAEENAGPSATAPPRLYAGVTAGLTIQPSAGAGGTWDGSRSWRNLLEVIQEIARPTLVDFKVVGTGPATFELRAKAYPWGNDRSVQGLDPATGLNAAGNAPVIFSLAFGNMGSASYTRQRTDEANAVVVLGQGLEADRMTVEVDDAAAIAISPWNRREVTRNANLEADAVGLQAVGEQLIHDLRARQSFTFTVLQSAAVRYGRDYRLGDLVTARFKAIEKNYQIIGVTVSVENGRETISLDVQEDD